MTADIRTAAQRAAAERWPDTFVGQIAAKADFVDGAVWGAARVTPTLAQLESAIMGRTATAGARAVLALMAGLAEGESSE